jgi:hypothetical protein
MLLEDCTSDCSTQFLQTEAACPKRNLVAWVQHDFGVDLNHVFVDTRAVGAAQIGQINRFATDLEQGVFAADTRVCKHDVVASHASEVQALANLEINGLVGCDQLPASCG